MLSRKDGKHCKYTVQWFISDAFQILAFRWTESPFIPRTLRKVAHPKTLKKVSARPFVLATLLFRSLHCSSESVFPPTFCSWNVNKMLCQRLWPATTKVWRISAVVKFVQLVALWELSERLSCLAGPPADIVLNPVERRDDLHTI